jgi:hypothetical protein
VEPKVRSWFLRNALDVFANAYDAAMRERFQLQVPKRLAPLLAPGRLRGESPLATLPLGDVEDLLFALDAVIGLGAGTSMEVVGEQVIGRAFADGNASVTPDNLASTAADLCALLSAPFVDTELSYQVQRHPDDGFTVTLRIPGRPRAARLLRHYSIGAIRAAALRMREPTLTNLVFHDESSGDRATIKVSVRRGRDSVAPRSQQRLTPANVRSNSGSLELEVARILGAGRDGPPSSPVLRRSQPPPKPDSVRPPGRSNQGSG